MVFLNALLVFGMTAAFVSFSNEIDGASAAIKFALVYVLLSVF